LTIGAVLSSGWGLLAQNRPVLERSPRARKPAPAEQSADGTPVFRSEIKLIQVDVVVRAKGQLVRDLKKEDFDLYDNGKQQTIAVFVERDTHPAGAASKAVAFPKGIVSNRIQNDGPEPVAATVILLDGQNTLPEDQMSARIKALKYLDGSSREEVIAVYQLDSTLRVLQDFTTDKALVRTAIDKFKAALSASLNDELVKGLSGNAISQMQRNDLQRRTDITTAAFNDLSVNLRGMPGRKKLVWISASLPPTITQTESHDGGVATTEYTNFSGQLYAPAKAMNAANIAVYPVDPRSTLTPLDDPNITTMIAFADMTGGRAFYNTNAMDESLRDAIADTDITYTLGFYPTETERNDDEHSIRIKMKGDMEAHYRNTYVEEQPPKPYTEAQRTAALDGWAGERIDTHDIAIYASAAPSQKRKGYYQVGVVVNLADLMLEEKDGRHVGTFELAVFPDKEKKPIGLRQRVAVNLTEANYKDALKTGLMVINEVQGLQDDGTPLAKRYHVIVMDNKSLRAGSLRLPIDVPADVRATKN
jgi:VWFA-related protein